MKTKIIVIGSGFAGMAAVKGLVKNIGAEVEIVLISKYNYQLFNSNLFEVATAEEDFVTVDQLKKSITIPVAEAVDLKKIKFVQDTVTTIDQDKKIVQAGTRIFEYDYLIVAAGSISDYFGIPGAQQFSLPLKSLTDALRIKNQIEFAIQQHRSDTKKINLHIAVAGGGYTGVEFAAELSHMIEIVAWKNNYPPEKIEISIIEATSALIPGFSERLSQDALWKLKERGVRVLLSSPITSVDEHYISLASGERQSYDVLVWTTGVKAIQVPFARPMNMDKKGRLITKEFLQTDRYENIFAIGDCACVVNKNGLPAPSSAQDAIAQGAYLGNNLPKIIFNKRPHPYQGSMHGFIVTLGGKSAILSYGKFYVSGWMGYVIRQGANFRYYYKTVGPLKAVQYLILEWNVFTRND